LKEHSNGGDGEMDKQNSNRTWFYSTFSDDIPKMLLDGKRVAALIEIDAKEYPQGFVKRSAGTPNCKCIIGEDTVDIIKLGETHGLFMKKQEQKIVQINVIDLEYLYLGIRKQLVANSGYHYLFLDLKSKANTNPLKFAISSLKPFLLLWNHPAFAAVEKRTDDSLVPLLNSSDPDRILIEIEHNQIEIPLVTD
jgi:hypothetical protein